MRKIFIITERRADYSRFQPILNIIKDDPDLEYDLVVTGLHLKHENGYTIDEIKSDGFKIFSTFEMASLPTSALDEVPSARLTLTPPVVSE